jgi:hypothetical protein
MFEMTYIPPPNAVPPPPLSRWKEIWQNWWSCSFCGSLHEIKILRCDGCGAPRSTKQTFFEPKEKIKK